MKSQKLLERQIRRAALAQLRASKPLWRGYKNMRRSWFSWLRKDSNVLALLLPAGVLSVPLNHGALVAPLLLLALYSAGLVLYRSAQFSAGLYRSMALVLFMHVPASDQDFFDFLWRSILRSSAWTFIYSLLAFGFLAVKMHLGSAGWAAVVVAAILQWLLVVSLIPILGPRSWAPRLGTPAVAIYCLTFIAAFVPAIYAPVAFHTLLPLPTSWIPIAFERGFLNANSGAFGQLFFASLLLATLPLSLRHFRARYPVVELVYPLETRPAENAATDPSATADDEQNDGTQGSEHLSLRFRIPPAKLRGLNWDTMPWLERAAGRLLSPREKVVAQFLCGGDLGIWSKSWLTGSKVAAIAFAAILFPGQYVPWISLAILILAAVCAVPVTGGIWTGLNRVRIPSATQSVLASAPLSYTEVSRTVLKINLLRFVAWAPIVLAGGALLARRFDLSPLTGTAFAVYVLLATLAAQPLTLALLHSQGTSDTRRIHLQSIALLTVISCEALAYAASAALFFIAWIRAPEFAWPLSGIAGFVGMLLFSSLVWYSYKIFYNRGRVDTIRIAD